MGAILGMTKRTRRATALVTTLLFAAFFPLHFLLVYHSFCPVHRVISAKHDDPGEGDHKPGHEHPYQPCPAATLVSAPGLQVEPGVVIDAPLGSLDEPASSSFEEIHEFLDPLTVSPSNSPPLCT